MKTITEAEGIPALVAILAENPDRLVDTCRYQVDGRPECVVGYWLDRFGVPLPTVHSLNGATFASTEMDNYLDEKEVEIGPILTDLLAKAQLLQDGYDLDNDGNELYEYEGPREWSTVLTILRDRHLL